VNDQTLDFVSRRPLLPEEELEVEVTFSHGVLNVSKPAWQLAKSDVPTQIKGEILTVVLIIMGALLGTMIASKMGRIEPQIRTNLVGTAVGAGIGLVVSFMNSVWVAVGFAIILFAGIIYPRVFLGGGGDGGGGGRPKATPVP